MNRSLFAVLFAALFFVSSQAQATCYCVKEWIWGGCAVHECYAELSGGGGSAGNGLGYHKINIKNECSRTLTAGIHFIDMTGNWQTNGWYNLQPGEQAYVANTKNRIYYIYAESFEPESTRLKWDGTDNYSPIHGSPNTYGFLKREITLQKWGTWTQHLKCDGLTRFHALAIAWNAQGAGSIQKANTVEEAQARALTSCNEVINGGTNCTAGPVVYPSSFACMTIARSGDRLFSGIGNTMPEAELSALQACTATMSGCTMALRACND